MDTCKIFDISVSLVIVSLNILIDQWAAIGTFTHIPDVLNIRS